MTRALVGASLAGLLTLAAIPPFAYGWGDVGHMMVAYVAYNGLTPAAKARANALLRLNPRYDDWLTWLPGGASKADKEMMIFMIAATWPDQIKRDPSYTSDGSHGGNRPEGSPDPTANSGYGDRLMHKYWHFVDTPFAQDGTTLPPIPTPNAGERIKLFRGVLASPAAADPLKSYDLAWLLHLIGDVHQPLHCATRVSAAEVEGDDGGNKVRVTCAACPSHLHTFWDDVPGTASSTEAAIAPALAAAKKLRRAKPSAVAKLDETQWIDESFELTQQKVYQPPIGDGDGPFVLTPAYERAALALARSRIALAGARLGKLLNQELK